MRGRNLTDSGKRLQGDLTEVRKRRERTVTRADLGAAVCRECQHVSQRAAQKICGEVLEEIVSSLVEGEQVRLTGFGNFVLRKKGSRIGRNLQTGAKCEITARISVSFKPSPVMAARVNGSSQDRPILGRNAKIP